MRLLQLNSQGTFCLTDDLDDDPRVVPRYAILSHTWGDDSSEVKFRDIHDGTAIDKAGYAKLEFCAKQAKKDNIDYFWIDTCCINKDSDAELSQAIRSMFRWYRNAKKCYVFLSDVWSSGEKSNDQTRLVWENRFRNSKWFARGWTLQELLAPKIVEFFSLEGVLLGCKHELVQQIYEITGIPTAALLGESITNFSIEQRFSWAKTRKTAKAEDKAYCLFGIFDVQLPVLYGEGQENALRRLRREIGVTLADLDSVIQTRYDDGRLNVERLSGKSLPLEYCFINLSIIDHVHDDETRLGKEQSNQGRDQISQFSLPARLNVETPPKSHQVSLSTLFKPRQQEKGTQLRPKRILIWGRAGMGKTTLCKKIVYDVYKNGLWQNLYDRVIWLPLRRLKRLECRNIIELLQNEFPLSGLGDRSSETLEKLVRNDRTLFLLDGLDEVSFVLDQDSPMGYVLRDLLSQPHVIITSRPHSTYMLDLKRLDLTVETIGFQPQQVEDYLQRVVKQTNSADGTVDEIRSFINERPLMQSLAGIPILLDAISYTWNTTQFLQAKVTMTTLYMTVSQNLWKNSILRLEKQGINKRPITKQQLDYWRWPQLEKCVRVEIDFLQELSFRGLCEDVIEFSLMDIETSDTLQQVSSDQFVHLLFLRVSDSCVDVENQTVHFVHLTFQELFAAQYFVSSWINSRLLPIRQATNNDRLSNQSVQFITPEEFVRSRKYLDRFDIFWRFVAGLLLTQPEKDHFYRFLNAIEDEPMDLIGLAHQRLIIHCLSELGTSDEELEDLIERLEDRCSQWMFSEFILSGMSEHSDPSGLLIWETECTDKILIRLLNHVETESAALKALRRRSNLSSHMLSLIICNLSNSTNEYARNTAVQIIGEKCGKSQEEKVQQLFNDMQHLRITTREIVSAWRETERLREPAIETLLRLLHDPDDYVRFRAMRALGRQLNVSSTVADALAQLLQDRNQDLDMRISAIWALGRYSTLSGTVIEILVQQLQDPDQEFYLQSRIVTALGQQTSLLSTAVNALIRQLQIPDQSVQFKAAVALQSQTTLPSMAVETLIRLFQSTGYQWYPRFDLPWIIGRQTVLSSTAVEMLVEMIQDLDQSSGHRLNTIKILERQPTLFSQIVKDYLQRLHRPLHLQCRQAMRAVIADTRFEIFSGMPEEKLVTLLYDPDRLTQCKALWALDKNITLSATMVNGLVHLLQGINRDLETPSNTTTVSMDHLIHYGTAFSIDIGFLPHESCNLWAAEGIVGQIIRRREIRSLIPTFTASILRHFVIYWFMNTSEICFIEDHSFCVQGSTHIQRIPIERNQVKQFKAEWQKAREGLDLLPLVPVFFDFEANRFN